MVFRPFSPCLVSIPKPFPQIFTRARSWAVGAAIFSGSFRWLLANFTGTFVSRQPLLREGQAYAEIRRYGLYDATAFDEWSENNNDNS